MDGYMIGMLAFGGTMIALVGVFKLYERIQDNRKHDRQQEMFSRRGHPV